MRLKDQVKKSQIVRLKDLVKKSQIVRLKDLVKKSQVGRRGAGTNILTAGCFEGKISHTLDDKHVPIV